jgi:hypothetical protein
MRIEHDLCVREKFVGGVDYLLEKIRHCRVADHTATNEHAIAGMDSQLMLEVVESFFRRAMDEFVIEAFRNHALAQVG